MSLDKRFRFDQIKALEVLLYIAQNCSDMYNVLKVLYFADKQHLENYGRLICGESYVAMSHGPVPSGTYDMIKFVRGDGIYEFCDLHIKESFHMEKYHIVPHREPRLELLSESEIECLDSALTNYGRMSFSRLKELSHRDKAYQSADENDFIPLEAIIKSLPSSEALLEYLQDD